MENVYIHESQNVTVRERTVPNEKNKVRFDESQLIDSLIIRVVTGRNHEANRSFIAPRISNLIDIFLNYVLQDFIVFMAVISW